MAETPTNPPAANSKTPTTTTAPPAGGAPTVPATPAAAPATQPTQTTDAPGSNQPAYEDPGCAEANSDGSPSFMGDEGGAPASTEPGTPVPPAAGLRKTDTDFKGNKLPAIPSSGNYNAMAKDIRISHYYTLQDILNPAIGGTARIPDSKIAADRRWTGYQIVQNLRDLFVLCVDPIRARFGKGLVITSTLRPKSNGSAHNVGWGIDMQFASCGYVGGRHREVANIIARLGIPYDQLLYEWAPAPRKGADPSKAPWIHIGLRQPTTLKVRGDAQSFYRDKPFGKLGQFDQMPGLRG
jgi:hypothetical protein